MHEISLVLTKQILVCLQSYFNITSVVIMWYFITSYDVHLSHCAYTIVICSVFNIMLRFLYFIKSRMYWQFNFTLVFFKAVCHANLRAKRSFAGSSLYILKHIFLRHIVESSQRHQLTIMYRFEHTNHDVLLNLLFQNLYKLFWRVHNLYQ